MKCFPRYGRGGVLSVSQAALRGVCVKRYWGLHAKSEYSEKNAVRFCGAWHHPCDHSNGRAVWVQTLQQLPRRTYQNHLTPLSKLARANDLMHDSIEQLTIALIARPNGEVQIPIVSRRIWLKSIKLLKIIRNTFQTTK